MRRQTHIHPSHAPGVALSPCPLPVLTACLACGWVHGYPWRCPESTAKGDRVFRVAKSNTLLFVPNDWPTLTNGTVDGVPTGRPRYLGEQRFVFVLLNVTDGNGNLASYDFETRTSGGSFADLSGNGLRAYYPADQPSVPAVFGRGARLTATDAPFAADDPKLDDITNEMTVAFWVRPDVDYGGGTTGWRWSAGREGLWRLGYYEHFESGFHGLRFEVKDTNGNIHFVQAQYPLRAGRWVHLAGVLTRAPVYGITHSHLHLYVNGAKVATWAALPTFSAMDGSTPLRIGHDSAGGGRFKGLVDEFRLYTTALSDDGVHGLMWFLAAKNGVLVPRGVFFDSELFGALNGSWDPNSPQIGRAHV